jgi:hypothetical protein
MRTIVYGGHTIEVKTLGTEKIHYDGRLVSSKNSWSGATHIFSVKEGNENVQYEVEVGGRWHGLSAYVIVRRNGIIIFSDR